MTPVIDHVHLTVEDLSRAEAFYDKLLPLLGFRLEDKEWDEVAAHAYQIVEYHSAALSLGLVSMRQAYAGDRPSRRRAGALHHLAFRAESRGAVDALYEQVLRLPAQIVHPPRLYTAYCPDYYAFFFKDSEGMELEITAFDRAGYFAP